MTKINDLNTIDTLRDGDLFPAWAGSTRAITAASLAEYLMKKIGIGSAFIHRVFATAGQTQFFLPVAYTPGTAAVTVFVNGLRLDQGSDFTETNPQTITFTSGLALNDLVTFVINANTLLGSITAFPASSVSAFGQSLIDDANAAAGRATLGISAFGSSLIDDADAAAARTTLGLGSLATLNTINNGNWSGTALAIANGGTGATTAGAALTALGGQPLDATLTAIAGLSTAAGDYIEATGADTFRLLKLFINSISGTPSHVGQIAVVGGFGHIAIDTVGSGDWRLITWRDTSIPEATAAEIADVTDPVNTTTKYARQLIWDTTNNELFRASGNAAADPWYVVGGGAINSISGTPSYVGQQAVVGGFGHVAIGTASSGDWRLSTWRDSSIAVATAAAIADITDAENTTNKYTGKLIWDSTNKRLLRAFDGAAGADWEVVDGSAQVTPA